MEPRLPLELVAMVVDHLKTDKPSLSACCLVSRQWLHFCRAYLFSAFRIDGPFNDIPFDVSFETSPIPIYLTPFVRTLVFSGLSHRDTAIHPYILSSRKLVGIAKALPNLNSVELRDIKVDIDPPLSTLLAIRTLTLLRYGDADSVLTQNPAQNLYGLFPIFPQLENLYLTDTPIFGFKMTLIQPLLPKPTSLELHDCYRQDSAMETLATIIDFERLQRVSVRAKSGNIHSIGRCLPRAAQTLTHFTFDLKCSATVSMNICKTSSSLKGSRR